MHFLRCSLLLGIFCALITISNATPLEPGASYNEVISQLGQPDGEINAGNRQILTYGKAQIKLKNGRVSSISPQLNQLLAERDSAQDSVEAKRAAGLINYKGKWMSPSQRDVLIAQEKKQQPPYGGLNSAARNWITDYDQALAMAKAQNKQVLLNFTGSDWCGWCIKLDKEVFSQQSFLNYANSHYILVKLDFPRRSQIPAYLKTQNTELAEKYKIRGFPTIVVLDSNGKKYRTSGYVSGGPQAFINSIR
ncbi:thioredoxin family protein [Coraliomargarita sp. SDUM461004]|uniref:Thioredoxin family protein n=1 Tax=Thalassobacterium sedimentorum TaxID=3041258 RepID=A0ABU1AMX7_9BACT|nr:thioredoxin family protein [Coraliomargarita sp. SDUM461004]MDQ8195205.1 thioredoxin family protein [Coraliomargarita sp. SDUM461004]